jgi:hypothetical protein
MKRFLFWAKEGEQRHRRPCLERLAVSPELGQNRGEPLFEAAHAVRVALLPLALPRLLLTLPVKLALLDLPFL